MKVYWHVLLQAALKFMWDWPHDFYPKIQGQENPGWWLAFVGGGTRLLIKPTKEANLGVVSMLFDL